jgi:hypothetical protein
MSAKSSELLEPQEVLEPSYLLFHTLPNQEANGGGLLTYSNWPPGRVPAAGPEPRPLGIEATASNVPLEWPNILNLANTELHRDKEIVPVVPIGGSNALVNYGANAGSPFFLVFHSVRDRRIFLSYIRGRLDEKFRRAVSYSWSFSLFSTTDPCIACRI